jgi:hypothetical protein
MLRAQVVHSPQEKRKMPGWKKIVTTALIVVVTFAVLNRVMAKSPAVANIING